jgi:hypothetical protein
MEISISIDGAGGFVRFTVNGKAESIVANELLETMRVNTERLGHRCILLNLLSVTGTLSTVERFNFGLTAVEQLRNVRKVAVVQASSKDSGFGALVARNRGLRMEVFSGEDQAIEWLTAP